MHAWSVRYRTSNGLMQLYSIKDCIPDPSQFPDISSQPEYHFPIDSLTGRITYKETVFTNPEVTNEELCNLAKKWIKKNYKRSSGGLVNEDSESETIRAKGAVPLLDGTLGCIDYNLSIQIIKGAYQYTLSGFQHRDFFCDYGPCEGYLDPNFTLVLTSKEWDKMIIYESRKTIDETVNYLAEEMKKAINGKTPRTHPSV